VGQARGEVERAVGSDSADRARCDAQLAFEARVVLDRVIVSLHIELGEHRAEEHEVAELRVDEIAVNAHMAEAGSTAIGLCDTTQGA
jgi:hypothetical protein